MEDGFSLKESTVGIIGLGLMGGSLAMSLKGQCARILGFDSHPATLELALSKNIVDQAESLTRGKGLRATVDLLILATPVPVILDLLQQLPSLVSHPCIVMDIGSTKRDILQAMSALPDSFEPIGGHPICGKEKLGLENAEPNLFQNAPFVVTPLDRSTRRANAAAQQMVSAVGANLLEMSAEDHDRILASTSHLPFLIASSLAHSTPPQFSPLLGTGFRSTSRLAGTPAHMMMGVLMSNRINILNSIQSFRSSLHELETLLQDQNYMELENALNASRNSYLSLISAQ